jgi:hypothetical protein
MRISLMLAGVVLLGAASAAGAVDLYVNGKQIVTQPGVVVEQGVSYGPLRAVAQAVGAEVEWHAAQQFATVCRGTACVKVQASEGILREDHLLLPLRKLAETLGGTVRWTGGATPRVEINMPPG